MSIATEITEKKRLCDYCGCKNRARMYDTRFGFYACFKHHTTSPAEFDTKPKPEYQEDCDS